MCQLDIIDDDSNLSDHLPLHIVCKSTIFEATGKHVDKNNVDSEICVERFRWDHGDLLSYYNATRPLLQPVLDDIYTPLICLFLTHQRAFTNLLAIFMIVQLIPYRMCRS